MLSQPPRKSVNGIALLSLGFRPFFLVAGVSAAASLLIWLAMLHGLAPISLQFPGSAWHAHEMLFGYTMAVVAGFLLTAVRNWTGQPTAADSELAVLVLVWLAGRMLPWLALPPVAAGIIAAAFPVLLALSLRRPLWTGSNRVNRVFLAILGGMGIAAFWSHLQAGGVVPAAVLDADALMLDLTLLTLMIVSGRVLPFFTRSALPGAEPRVSDRLDAATFAAAGAWVAADLFSPWPALAGSLALLLALLLTLRVAGWHDRRAWGIPILAVLYAGAVWLVLGLALGAAADFGLMAPTPALHALTAGAIGVFTLGMMVRITLGHTGRAMRAPPLLVAAFIAVNAAAGVRVFLPLLWPGAYDVWMLLSGLLWVAAFGGFLAVQGPMLIRPRADGRPI
ncbi:MAG: NnrS family protein [Thiohalocapsa sp.]|nr:NnrS family protein [Thiohalocapsa sp.]